MVKKYRKKPVEVEAVQWTGDNYFEVEKFTGGNIMYKYRAEDKKLMISTLEGHITASNGDFIIKGVKGEFYPCKPDIFYETHEEVRNGER